MTNIVERLRDRADRLYADAALLTDAANEIASLKQAMLGANIAIVRDGDIDSAVRLTTRDKFELSEDTKARLKEIDDNIRNAHINADKLIAG